MQVTNIADQTMQSLTPPRFSIVEDRVRTTQLLQAFNAYAKDIDVLSLDCFDTLVWRTTDVPVDVFYELQKHPLFKANRISAIQRMDAEDRARRQVFVRFGITEVTLQEIYHCGFTSLSDDTIDQLIEAEIETEQHCCYAFPAVVELIRHAHALGKKVVVVSNTYLKQNELQRLLAHVLPADVMGMLSDLFCSVDFRSAKEGQLFAEVLARIKIPADRCLHVGDNPKADLAAARKYGLHAINLCQFDPLVSDLLRMQAIAGSLADPEARRYHGFSSPFRGLYAGVDHLAMRPETLVGYLSLGPVMYAFARMVCAEYTHMQQAGKKPNLVYLMRDAYLPSLCTEILAGAPIGTQIRISRFTAIAASFRAVCDVDLYLSEECSPEHFPVMCKQLCLPEETAQTLIALARASIDPIHAFADLIHQPEILQKIFAGSAVYRERMKKYLLREANLQPGETLLLVDLGYVGRTQRALSLFLPEEMQLAGIYGLYLLAISQPEWHLTRKALFDASWCDDRVITMLCANCSLLEELCSSADKSVIHYDSEGQPIFVDGNVTEAQCEKVQMIQGECLRFVRDAQGFFANRQNDLHDNAMQRAALSELMRCMYLPLDVEMQYLQGFRHDVHKGSDEYFEIFATPAAELTSLRRRGVWFKQQHPFGLRAASLDAVMLSMTQQRLAFDVNQRDLSLRRESLPVIVQCAGKQYSQAVAASATHDGYFSLLIALSARVSDIAILIGVNYEIIQLERVEVLLKKHMLSMREEAFCCDVTGDVLTSNIMQLGGKGAQGIFVCQQKNAALLLRVDTNIAFDAGDIAAEDEYVLRMIFRPIVRREASV